MVDVTIGALSPTYDVRLYGADPTGVADSTVPIQAALTAARVAGGGTVIGQRGSRFLINAALVIGSKVTLDVRGATITSQATTHSQITNYNHLGGSRDTDISVIGGTWVAGGGTVGISHQMDFNQVDRLVIKPDRMVSTSGGYSIAPSDVTYFLIEGGTYDVSSAVCQVIGPASFGTITGLSGKSQDDFVTLICQDFPAQDICRGDITDVTISNLKLEVTTGVAHAVLLTAASYLGQTTTMAMRRITVRDIKGTANRGILIGYGITDANASMSDITISDISLILSTAQAQVVVDEPNPISGLRIENIHIPAGAPANSYGVDVLANISNLVIDGILSAGSLKTTGVTIGSGVTVGTLLLNNVAMVLGTADSIVVEVPDGATITNLMLTSIATGGTGAGSIVSLAGTGAAPRIGLVNVVYNSGNGAAVYLRGSASSDVTISNVQPSSGSFFWLTSTGNLTIRGAGGPVTVYQSGAQTVTAYSFAVQGDASALKLVAGAYAYNTNGGRACGIGPMVSEGTHWKGLYSGATYP